MGQKQTSSSFKECLSKIRHDMRTPVGHIIGYAEMLYEDMGDDLSPEFQRDLQTIKSSGERMVALIDEFFSPAKQSVDELDLKEAQFQMRLQLNHISGYSEMLREQAIDDELEDLLTDLDHISEAERRLVDLIERQLNASAFEAQLGKENEKEVATPEAGAGPTADTDDGEGDAKRPAEMDTLEWLAEGGEILVVDDEPSNRDLLTRRLSRQGYEPTAVESGEAALEILNETRFDLILLDLMMPGLSGLETLERIKSIPRLRNIPVMMLSASDDMDVVVQCVLKGAEDYIFKPFNPILLRARIGACLEKTRLRQSVVKQLKIFISSPGDVIPERRIVKRVISQLNEEFMGTVFLVPVLWEEEPLLASETFQAQIHPPHKTDILIGILWSRIGSPLPESILRPDGTRYDSGTAFEFEDAMAGFKKVGRPEILLYRKTGAPTISLGDKNEVLERLDQMERLERYIDSWLIGDDGSYIGAFHTFNDGEQFETMVETHLRKLVEKWIAEQE